ncbi:MAG: DUF1501 domain-containing protein [Pirellulaceae bacterium]
MDGGVSQVDTFDPKPRLTRDNGRPFAMRAEPTQFENNGATLGSPWRFRQYGESGLPVSELFPHVAGQVDRLCVVRSMVSNFSEHNAANYFLHTGHGMSGRPSMGAWATYGLGSENQDLPGYVVLDGGLIPSGGVDCFGAGFLPATFQASLFQNREPALANVERWEATEEAQRRKLAAVGLLDARSAELGGMPDGVEAAMRNQELAFQMQASVPEATRVTDETLETQRLYGMEAELARLDRLVGNVWSLGG